MSTHDLIVANDTMPNVRADINSGLQALGSQMAGTADPSTMYSYERQARTDLGVIRRRNAANSGWLIDATLAETLLVDRSSNTILGTADHQRTYRATSSYTQTVTAAATLTDGWYVDFRIEAGVTLIVDPNGSENIDGATTKTIVGPASGRICCNGAAFYTIGFAASPDYANLSEDASPDTTNDFLLSYDVSASAWKKIGLYRQRSTQAQAEAGTDDTHFLTPTSANWHPGVAKAWCQAGVAGNILASWNMTSVTDNGTGDITFTIATDFSSANYCAQISADASGDTSSPGRIVYLTTPLAGSIKGIRCNPSGTAVDPTSWYFVAWGDQ